jgi:Na+/H+ antiporter NhaC
MLLSIINFGQYTELFDIYYKNVQMYVIIFTIIIRWNEYYFKVLFMTTNYVTIIITNPLIYNSEDKKNKNHSNSKNLLKNMHNFSV